MKLLRLTANCMMTSRRIVNKCLYNDEIRDHKPDKDIREMNMLEFWQDKVLSRGVDCEECEL